MPQIIIRSVPWSPCTKNAAKEGGQRESLQNKFTKVVQSQPDWCNLNQNKFIKLDEKIQQKSYRYHSATIQLKAQNKGIIFSTASVCMHRLVQNTTRTCFIACHAELPFWADTSVIGTWLYRDVKWHFGSLRLVLHGALREYNRASSMEQYLETCKSQHVTCVMHLPHSVGAYDCSHSGSVAQG